MQFQHLVLSSARTETARRCAILALWLGRAGAVLHASRTPAGELLQDLVHEELACASPPTGPFGLQGSTFFLRLQRSKRARNSVLYTLACPKHAGQSVVPPCCWRSSVTKTPDVCGILTAPIAGVGAHGVPTNSSNNLSTDRAFSERRQIHRLTPDEINTKSREIQTRRLVPE